VVHVVGGKVLAEELFILITVISKLLLLFGQVLSS